MRTDVLIVDPAMDYWQVSGISRMFDQARISFEIMPDLIAGQEFIEKKRPKLVVSEYAGPCGELYDKNKRNYFHDLMISARLSRSFFGIATNWSGDDLEDMLSRIRYGAEFVDFIASKSNNSYGQNMVFNIIKKVVKEPEDFMRRYCKTYLAQPQISFHPGKHNKYRDMHYSEYNDIMRNFNRRR